jgi:hypothetical protein
MHPSSNKNFREAEPSGNKIQIPEVHPNEFLITSLNPTMMRLKWSITLILKLEKETAQMSSNLHPFRNRKKQFKKKL